MRMRIGKTRDMTKHQFIITPEGQTGMFIPMTFPQYDTLTTFGPLQTTPHTYPINGTPVEGREGIRISTLLQIDAPDTETALSAIVEYYDEETGEADPMWFSILEQGGYE